MVFKVWGNLVYDDGATTTILDPVYSAFAPGAEAFEEGIVLIFNQEWGFVTIV